MHHLYPLAKGDPLCPLGFHPQVRWPTRCKRCFRDYKEHGGKRREDESALRRDDVTLSTPTLASWGTPRENGDSKRSWASSTNLVENSREKRNSSSSDDSDYSNPSSWTSSPDLNNLEDDTQANVPTVSVKLPRRKQIKIDTGQRTTSDSFSVLKSEKSSVFDRNDNLATRAKKLQAIKSTEKPKRIHVREINAVEDSTNNEVKKVPKEPEIVETVDSEDDTVSIAGTETTDTTLVDRNDNELRDQLDSLKKELDETKKKCDRLEREKGNILLRRLTAIDTPSAKSNEVLKLQQRCNEVQSQLEDYKDEKKTLDLRVKELEEELETRPTVQAAQKVVDELRSKLLAAETLCEELMDENEDMKKECRDLEDEMEEMQDNFREEQADEYTSLKKELEQTTKNCRILSFKLRKSERKVEQLETEKTEVDKKLKEVSGGQSTLSHLDKIKKLEKDLSTANETAVTLQKKLEEANSNLSKAEKTDKTTGVKKAPMLSSIAKSDGKVSRESLTRGGSQDDPAQLLRDLQDSMEREADLREQLKYAEEEAQNLRKKVSRIEDDNESLVLQLKKMATKARSRKLSPTNNRLTPEASLDKEVSDDEDPSELKLQIELSEQQLSVLRKKVEELEVDNGKFKKKAKELQDKLNTKTTKRSLLGDKDNNQKLKALEEELNELKKKLQEKEKDCDRIQSELNLTQKRKAIPKLKSVDVDQQTIDLKRQLQIIEQETSVLRTKVQALETENEKLSVENKKLQLLKLSRTNKSDKALDLYIDKIATLEVELSDAKNEISQLKDGKKSTKSDNELDNTVIKKLQIEKDELIKTLEKLKADSTKAFKDRTPKKPTELTTKSQLRTMVTDLEGEISEMLVALKNNNSSKLKLEDEIKQLKTKSNRTEYENTVKELEEVKKKLKDLQEDLKQEKTKVSQEKTKYEEVNKKLNISKDNLTKSNNELDTLKTDSSKLKETYNKLSQEKAKLEEEIKKLKIDSKKSETLKNEVTSLKQNINDLKNELEKKDKDLKKTKEELDDKTKANKELLKKNKKILELENALQEADEKIKTKETSYKDEIKQLQLMIQEEKEINHASNSKTIDELKSNIESLETTIQSKNMLIKKLEKEKTAALDSNKKASSTDTKEINLLKDELKKANNNLSDIEAKLESAQKNKKTLEEKLKKVENELKADKIEYEKKISELGIDLQNEKKKIEVMKSNNEKEQRNRELELSTLKNKIKSLELQSGGSQKIMDIKKEYQEKVDKLELSLLSEKREYEDLTAKYEILEEEHVVTKAKLVMEKESLTSQLQSTKKESEALEKELQTLRETYNNKQDAWIKEKLEIQEQLKSLEIRAKNGGETNLEKIRLQSNLEDRQAQYDQLKKQYDVIHDQMEYIRKENDELKQKLDDYNKVNKIQRNISADSSAMDKEIRNLRNKLSNADKSKKADIIECKLRYENQLSVMNEQLNSLQQQVSRFKRERDTYKHMLEGAQKTIGDLKTGPKSGRESRASIASFDELEESRTKIATLEQQISCMEDELSESRLESSKVKTELVSERSTWEIKLSEMQSRLNELEEEKILSSGRTKIAGIKTRMELAWHKEREEQQRLLQETATLARDLRQTLFEVERERDKERLESKRKQDQLKKSLDEDQEESKRKLTELQCDLLELRDAHAKLRTTNEKLRREKEHYEKQREEYKTFINGKKRTEQEDDRRINAIIEQIDYLHQIAPELTGNSDKTDSAPYTPTPPRRSRGSKSRETSPALERAEFAKEPSLVREDKKAKVQSTMQRLIDATEELKRFQKLSEEERDRDRIKRAMGMRRATSTEHDNGDSKYSRGFVRNGNTGSSLHRKSLSLEQTTQQEQNIWKGDDDSLSSMQSLNSDVDTRWSKRDASMDSRLSGGSTQSETGEKRKKKGLIGKLKKLTKSRSIDDQDPELFSPTRDLSSKPNSNTSVNEEARGSKKDLKERITGIFKRGGSSSRSNSVERPHDSSTQRPLMKS